ncbi:MAG: hypothetical protein Q8K86_06120 [Candidatus Nanopelagicaceae bacterium]|nr:hypothetical protein [Candidatus Nanopelagicaceae bacterium]
MRAYLAVTTAELSALLEKGLFPFRSAFILTTEFAQANPELDEEELEFQLSWIAAQTSRNGGEASHSLGFVLAVDLANNQIGDTVGEQIELLSEISWSQVESVLVSESEEPELTWYASQELATYLPAWKA